MSPAERPQCSGQSEGGAGKGARSAAAPHACRSPGANAALSLSFTPHAFPLEGPISPQPSPRDSSQPLHTDMHTPCTHTAPSHALTLTLNLPPRNHPQHKRAHTPCPSVPEQHHSPPAHLPRSLPGSPAPLGLPPSPPGIPALQPIPQHPAAGPPPCGALHPDLLGSSDSAAQGSQVYAASASQPLSVPSPGRAPLPRRAPLHQRSQSTSSALELGSASLSTSPNPPLEGHPTLSSTVNPHLGHTEVDGARLSQPPAGQAHLGCAQGPLPLHRTGSGPCAVPLQGPGSGPCAMPLQGPGSGPSALPPLQPQHNTATQIAARGVRARMARRQAQLRNSTSSIAITPPAPPPEGCADPWAAWAPGTPADCLRSPGVPLPLPMPTISSASTHGTPLACSSSSPRELHCHSGDQCVPTQGSSEGVGASSQSAKALALSQEGAAAQGGADALALALGQAQAQGGGAQLSQRDLSVMRRQLRRQMKHASFSGPCSLENPSPNPQPTPGTPPYPGMPDPCSTAGVPAGESANLPAVQTSLQCKPPCSANLPAVQVSSILRQQRMLRRQLRGSLLNHNQSPTAGGAQGDSPQGPSLGYAPGAPLEDPRKHLPVSFQLSSQSSTWSRLQSHQSSRSGPMRLLAASCGSDTGPGPGKTKDSPFGQDLASLEPSSLRALPTMVEAMDGPASCRLTSGSPTSLPRAQKSALKSWNSLDPDGECVASPSLKRVSFSEFVEVKSFQTVGSASMPVRKGETRPRRPLRSWNSLDPNDECVANSTPQ